MFDLLNTKETINHSSIKRSGLRFYMINEYFYQKYFQSSIISSRTVKLFLNVIKSEKDKLMLISNNITYIQSVQVHCFSKLI